MIYGYKRHTCNVGLVITHYWTNPSNRLAWMTQWLSAWLEIKGPLIWVSLEAPYCFLVQDTLYSIQYWFNPGNVPTWLNISWLAWADPEGRDRGSGPLPQRSQKIGFLSNTGPDPRKNRKATRPKFNVRPSSERQRTPAVSGILIIFPLIN